MLYELPREKVKPPSFLGGFGGHGEIISSEAHSAALARIHPLFPAESSLPEHSRVFQNEGVNVPVATGIRS